MSIFVNIKFCLQKCVNNKIYIVLLLKYAMCIPQCRNLFALYHSYDLTSLSLLCDHFLSAFSRIFGLYY
jgi:hypothetical protein